MMTVHICVEVINLLVASRNCHDRHEKWWMTAIYIKMGNFWSQAYYWNSALRPLASMSDSRRIAEPRIHAGVRDFHERNVTSEYQAHRISHHSLASYAVVQELLFLGSWEKERLSSWLWRYLGQWKFLTNNRSQESPWPGASPVLHPNAIPSI